MSNAIYVILRKPSEGVSQVYLKADVQRIPAKEPPYKQFQKDQVITLSKVDIVPNKCLTQTYN